MVCRTPPHYYGAPRRKAQSATEMAVEEAPWRMAVEEALEQMAVDESLRENVTSTPGASMDELTAAVLQQRDVPREENK